MGLGQGTGSGGGTQSSLWIPSVLWEKRVQAACVEPLTLRQTAVAVETAAEGGGRDGSLVGDMPGLRCASPTVQAGGRGSSRPGATEA